MAQLQPLLRQDANSALVEITNLQFGWRPARPLLRIESFRIRPSERVFIKGPSGSGKSTLLGLIGGVLTPQTGRINVCGHELSRMSAAQRDAVRAENIGFIFQMFNLIPYLSVLENVLLATRFSRKRKSHIAAAGLENEARRLLHALGLSEGELHSRKVAQLSIGQQQRVAAARALLGGPRLIIADEPTSSLDADARENFLQLLMRECSACNAAILFVSHDTALSVLFDRTIALNEINLVQQSAFV